MFIPILMMCWVHELHNFSRFRSWNLLASVKEREPNKAAAVFMVAAQVEECNASDCICLVIHKLIEQLVMD